MELSGGTHSAYFSGVAASDSGDVIFMALVWGPASTYEMVRNETTTYQGSPIPKVADPAWELRVPNYGRRQRGMEQGRNLELT